MFREIVKTVPLAAALSYGLWENFGVPVLVAMIVGIHAASTIRIAQLVKREASPL